MGLNDDQFFAEIGLGELPHEAIAILRRQNSERLDFNVEVRVKATLTEADHAKFDAFLENGDAAAAFAYLRAVLPAYQSIIDAETAHLERVLREEAPAIFAIEMALTDVRDVYEKCFSALDGCGGQGPPLA
jgi:hypothetical protein